MYGVDSSTNTANTYNLTYTVTDDNNCTGTDNITLTVNPNPTATISASSTEVCAGGTINLDGTSQAAAFVTGVCALAIEKMKNKQFDADLFTKILFQTAYSDSFTIQEYGHGIINPNKLVEATKQLLL
ncbi:MAG: S8 family serine peptidase [Bacteroidota bacterium]